MANKPRVFEYDPEPTLDKFHMSDARLRFVRGPVGSGKSTAMAMELFRRACEQEPGPDGVRRTRMVLVRNTLVQLKTTVLETVRGLFQEMMTYKVSESKITIKVNDVHTEWFLLPLDTPENIARLLSFEVTMAWCSEFRELDPEIIQAVFSRCGRYPSPINGGPTFYGLVCETNSFSEDSPWYDFLELDIPSNWDYFVQPGGREPNAENIQYLPETYYADMVESNTEDWVSQYVDNKITESLAGSAVFKKSFVPEFHTSEGLNYIVGKPLVLGVDTGRNPAAIIGQLDAWGRVLILGECHTEGCGMETFLTQFLRPLLTERFGNASIYMIIDPAGRQRSQIGEESVLDAIKRLGFSARLASTNAIEPRLRAVDKLFSSNIGGKAAILIDRAQCPDLLRALKHEYKYKRNKTTKDLSEVPEKLHPWSDLADALQYLSLGISNSLVGRELRNEEYERPRPMPVGAWV